MPEGRLRTVGAEIFYRLQGDGPLLLFIQGGDGDAEGCAAVVEALAARYTVLTYDPRGLSRSTVDRPPQDLRLEVHGDDAHALLAALADGPAIVCGVSRGALVGLDLAARHPKDVALLVVHEPPVTQLLPPDERERASADQRAVETAALQAGPIAAMKQFAEALNLDFQDREPGVDLPRPGPERLANLRFFLQHDAPAVRTYRLDIEALRRAPARIVAGAGETSAHVFTHRCAVELAKALGAPLALFPGGHAGPTTHPRGFARKLLDVLESGSASPGLRRGWPSRT